MEDIVINLINDFKNDFSVFKCVNKMYNSKRIKSLYNLNRNMQFDNVDVFSRFDVDTNVREYVYNFLKDNLDIGEYLKFTYENNECANIFKSIVEENYINIFEILHIINLIDMNYKEYISSCNLILNRDQYNNKTKFNNEIYIDSVFIYTLEVYVKKTVSLNKMSISNINMLNYIFDFTKIRDIDIKHIAVLHYTHYIILINNIDNEFIKYDIVENVIKHKFDYIWRTARTTGVKLVICFSLYFNMLRDNMVSRYLLGKHKFEKYTNFMMFFNREMYKDPLNSYGNTMLLNTNLLYSFDMVKLRRDIFKHIKSNDRIFKYIKNKYKGVNISECVLQIPEIYNCNEFNINISNQVLNNLCNVRDIYTDTIAYDRDACINNKALSFINIATTLSLYGNYNIDLNEEIIKLNKSKIKLRGNRNKISDLVNIFSTENHISNIRFIRKLDVYINKIKSNEYNVLMNSVKTKVNMYHSYYLDLIKVESESLYNIFFSKYTSGNIELINTYKFNEYSTLYENVLSNNKRISTSMYIHIMELHNKFKLPNIIKSYYNIFKGNIKSVILDGLGEFIDLFMIDRIIDVNKYLNSDVVFNNDIKLVRNRISNSISPMITCELYDDISIRNSCVKSLSRTVGLSGSFNGISSNAFKTLQFKQMMLNVINNQNDEVKVATISNEIYKSVMYINDVYKRKSNENEHILKEIYDINILKPVEIEFKMKDDPDNDYKIKIIRPLSIINLLAGKVDGTSCCQFIDGYANAIVKEMYFNKNMANGYILRKDKGDNKFKTKLLSLCIYDETNKSFCLDSVEYTDKHSLLYHGENKKHDPLNHILFDVIRQAYMSYINYLNIEVDDMYIGLRYEKPMLSSVKSNIKDLLKDEYKKSVTIGDLFKRDSGSKFTESIFKINRNILSNEAYKFYKNNTYTGSIYTMYFDSISRNISIYNRDFYNNVIDEDKIDIINNPPYNVVSNESDYEYTAFREIVFKS